MEEEEEDDDDDDDDDEMFILLIAFAYTLYVIWDPILHTGCT